MQKWSSAPLFSTPSVEGVFSHVAFLLYEIVKATEYQQGITSLLLAGCGDESQRCRSIPYGRVELILLSIQFGTAGQFFVE